MKDIYSGRQTDRQINSLASISRERERERERFLKRHRSGEPTLWQTSKFIEIYTQRDQAVNRTDTLHVQTDSTDKRYREWN